MLAGLPSDPHKIGPQEPRGRPLGLHPHRLLLVFILLDITALPLCIDQSRRPPYRSAPLPSSEVQTCMPMHIQCLNVVVGVDGVALWWSRCVGWVGGWSDCDRRPRCGRTVVLVSLSVMFLLVGVCMIVMRMPCEQFGPSVAIA